MNSSVRKIYEEGKVITPIENQISFHTNELDLHLFETKASTYGFELAFDEMSLITMLSGKKVMHFKDNHSFEFLPEESLVLDKSQAMNIDFPEADDENPTRCMALIISPDEVRDTLLMVNETTPKIENGEWSLDISTIKFENDQILSKNIERIILLASSNNQYREALGKLMTKELIINLLQSKARNLLLKETNSLASNNQLAFAINYIRDNQHKSLTVDEVADKAYMSKSTFHRHFKREIGITPNEFILSEKIKKAKYLLRSTKQSVSEIAYSLAFASPSQFIKHFKSFTGLTPLKFKQKS
ncbi:AraC family transcriptional regulator [Moheibacter sediminis]|uniref:Transcriptional regulator, AraC family n=1 Tax=Moheibacter sediminis TaxID=1434700 RepID=A0A1W2AKL7_9FLAO|nr:AraC family transcriptional regulator [Moheibacter sediminis]SMC61226.1 transcriptional regulator, AraC family [Moheibacter sediminis]